ncbi:CDGSH iron-sulfur domain-containing protein [Streptomyces sp. NPDC005393]|uniref:CDGSH iron-sulfur domain-containing protein n=1 Tax=Streptomyces sp. NPDC005393 TaxID=3157041 RepID=UPI0033B05A03
MTGGGARAPHAVARAQRTPSNRAGAGASAAQPSRPTALARTDSGQILVRGDLLIETADGPRKETRATLCGCGASRNDPYCDGSGPCGNAVRGCGGPQA